MISSRKGGTDKRACSLMASLSVAQSSKILIQRFFLAGNFRHFLIGLLPHFVDVNIQSCILFQGSLETPLDLCLRDRDN